MTRAASINILSRLSLLAVVTLCVAEAQAQQMQLEPRIGYVYPAGARRGDTVEILVGGQHLRASNGIHVTGEGISASVIEYYAPVVNLDAEQRQELQRQMRETFEKRLQEMEGRGEKLMPGGERLVREFRSGKRHRITQTDDTTKPEPVELPRHPLLRNLEQKSIRELLHIREEFLNRARRQPNAQIAETVLIEVVVARNATPGDREIRLITPQGLTNPMCFQVDLLQEVREQEPNDPKPYDLLPDLEAVEPPIIMNGQIAPGDVDLFRFRAMKGQNLVIDARARYLIPYLADAVPGWFQATLSLYDARGNEVAFADDYRFSPDPVLQFKVPEDGEYELEIRDAIYRGREDFVYRITLGTQPFITGMYPLGGQEGSKTISSIEGWNLPVGRMRLDTTAGADGIRRTSVRRAYWVSNPVSFAVGDLPECMEKELNDTSEAAQQIELPCLINGRIATAGDVDVYRFEGKSGDAVVAEVIARRLDSPLDSLLRLMDSTGKVLEWNDDHVDAEFGLCTHHADSYLPARLPADGVYLVQVSDAQHHGGEGYGYRLRVGSPQPDFALRVTPSSLNIRPGRAAELCVHVVRKDGYDGDVEVMLNDAPEGFSLQGGRVPAGLQRVRMTVTAPAKPLDKPAVLKLHARAKISGEMISRPVVPAEDMMQAFLYRHFVPSGDLMVAAISQIPGPPIELAETGPFDVPLGGTRQIRVTIPRRPMVKNIQLVLREPPEGVTLEKVNTEPDGLVLVLKAAEESARLGLIDNLIVEAFTEGIGGRQAQQKRRVSLGILPAIPIEIVKR